MWDRKEPLPLVAAVCLPTSRPNLDPRNARLSGGRDVALERHAAGSNRVMFLRDGRTPFPEWHFFSMTVLLPSYDFSNLGIIHII